MARRFDDNHPRFTSVDRDDQFATITLRRHNSITLVFTGEEADRLARAANCADVDDIYLEITDESGELWVVHSYGPTKSEEGLLFCQKYGYRRRLYLMPEMTLEMC